MLDKNGQPLVPLPPVTVITVKVPLDVATREFYDAVERESAARVNEFFLRGADPANVSVQRKLQEIPDSFVDAYRSQCAVDAHQIEVC